MANHPSAQKRHRQTVKRTERNKHVRTTVRTFVKRLRALIHEGDAASADTMLKLASQTIDRAVAKGVYARKTGSRYISRLSAQVSNLRKKAA